jgi:predicted ATPase
MPSDLFLSYASQDWPIADALCATLERAGLRCWIAPRDVQPGRLYAAQIVKAIGESRAVVVVLTTNANASRNVLNEVELAAGRERPIVPVRIDGVKPSGALEYYLNSVHWFDATKAPLESRFAEAAVFVAAMLELGPSSAPVAVPARDLLLSAAPLRSRYNNLPHRLTPLIGRADEVSSIISLLEKTRLVTIVGTGGTGKTRVALETGARLLGGFADGVWFVDLAPSQDPSFVVAAIASVLEVGQSLERPLIRAVVDHLRPRSLLLVIDNCEHVIAQAAADAEGILRECPGVRILATSREALQIEGEHVFHLPSLALPSAVQLFVERAHAIDSRFATTPADADLIEEICRGLDGIPLAIELAAACVGTLSVREICEGLSARFRILTRGSRTALPRHQTMRAAFDWSYDLLAEDEQRCFRRLAVFAGGFTADAAGSVCAIGDQVDDIAKSLGSLIGKSLLAVKTRDASRYELLESARAYARDQAGAEWELLCGRHAVWMQSFIQRMSESEWSAAQQAWLDGVEPELANIRVALDWSLRNEQAHSIAGGIVSGLASFWYDAGLVQEGLRWTQRALETLDEREQPLLIGRLWRAMAFISPARRSVDAAQKAVDVLRDAGDPAELAVALKILAAGLRQVGELDRGAQSAQDALDILTSQGLRRSRVACDALQVQGSIRRAQGSADAARSALDEALSLAEALGEERVAASLSGDLAELEFACGNTKRAIELATSAAEIFRRLTATTREATALVNASTYMLECGRVDDAQRTAEQALKLAMPVADSLVVAVALQNLSVAHAIHGNVHAAARLIGYVDAWYVAEGFERDVSERKTFDLVMNLLHDRLEDSTLEKLRSEGASWNEERAAREAAPL